MGRKSLIESSPKFDIILDMIENGFKAKDIHDILLKDHGVDIHERTIRRYIDKINDKINEEYYRQKNEEKPKIDEVIDKGVATKNNVDRVIKNGASHINTLDEEIDKLAEVDVDLKNLTPEYGPEGGIITSEADVTKIKLKGKSILNQMIKTRSDILKGEPEPPAINIFVEQIAKNKDDMDNAQSFLNSVNPNNKER